MEANPGTLEHDKFENYLNSGINRLSLGIQSFSDEHLQSLGRVHDSACSEEVIPGTMNAGFNNINLDLMYGLPNQNVEMAISDCALTISYQPSHISCYQLTIEPNTYFHRYPPTLPDKDLQFSQQQVMQERIWV